MLGPTSWSARSWPLPCGGRGTGGSVSAPATPMALESSGKPAPQPCHLAFELGRRTSTAGHYFLWKELGVTCCSAREIRSTGNVRTFSGPGGHQSRLPWRMTLLFSIRAPARSAAQSQQDRSLGLPLMCSGPLEGLHAAIVVGGPAATL